MDGLLARAVIMSVGSIRIGSPLGIPVRLHYTWWVIFLPVLFMLAQTLYPRMYPLAEPSTLWTMAAIATVLFFVSLLLHEFGHALAARRFGIPVHSVELFALGGAAKMIGFTRRPRDEFIMASAGPAISLAFAALTAGAYAVLRFAFHAEICEDLWTPIPPSSCSPAVSMRMRCSRSSPHSA